ncbi:MAG: hypothetical protein QF510_09920, partial [Rhodospirillales bacterium]|nr:hypothetical protein [Rhodospirillales bacterium]
DCCVFFPTSPLRVGWDALLLGVLFVLLFILPFRFGFRDARIGPATTHLGETLDMSGKIWTIRSRRYQRKLLC